MDEAHERHSSLLATAHSLQVRGEDVEQILQALRKESASVLESIKVIRELWGLSLSEAKDVIHHSDAWSDQRRSHDEVHERAIRVLNQDAPVGERDGEYRATIDLRPEDPKP